MKSLYPFLLLLFVLVGLTKCSKEPESLHQYNFNKFNLKGITFTLQKDSISADNNMYAEMILKVDSTISKNYKGVKFSIAPFGLFNNGFDTLMTTLNLNGETRVFVKSTKIGVTNVNAEIIKLTKLENSIHFITSYPDQLQLLPSVGTLSSDFDANTVITAKLLKKEGVVSKGFQVNFYDSTTSNKSIGIFLNTTTSNENGESFSNYSIQDTSYHGIVYLKAFININNRRIYGQNKILVK